MDDADIAIVGAGPTGLVLAAQLLRRGVPCRVLETLARRPTTSRAVGLSARSLEVLDEFGAAEPLIERGRRLRGASFATMKGRIGGVDLSTLEGTRFPFALAVPQWHTEEVLEERVVDLGGAVERGTTVRHARRVDDRVELDLVRDDGATTATAAWVVAADGRSSTVRESAGIAMVGASTGDVFAIADVELEEGPADDLAYYHFSPEGLLVVVPLPDGSYRLATTIPARPDTPLTTDDMSRMLRSRMACPPVVTSSRDAGWPTAVRIESTMATTFSQEPWLLAGDAAHVHSPVGGQGMNVGIQDAHALAWRLALVAQRASPPTLFRDYDAERRGVAQQVLRSTTAMTRLATIPGGPRAVARNVAVSFATRSHLIDKRLTPVLAQLTVDHRAEINGSTGGGGRRGPARRWVGRRAPDIRLTEGGTPTTNLHRVLSMSAAGTILVLDPSPEDAAGLAAVTAWVEDGGPAIDVRHVTSDHLPATAPEVGTGRRLSDPDGALRKAFGVKPGAAVVLRPDGHITAVHPTCDSAALEASIRSMLSLEPR